MLVAGGTVDDRDTVILDPVTDRAGAGPRGTGGSGEPGGSSRQREHSQRQGEQGEQ
jgi:hypothetical protein